MHTAIRLVALAIFSWAATPALSATHYVDSRHGSDLDPTTCKKTAPCLTIQKAIDVGGKRARILVAPGLYIESLVINEDSVTIQSLGGADVTTIFGLSSSEALIESSGSRFTLGGKGKGFTLILPTPDSGAIDGLRLNGDRAKIESNIIIGGDFIPYNNTDDAINVQGSKTTIRYNDISGFDYGIWVRPGQGERSDITIDENQIARIGNPCIDIVAEPRSRDKVRKNSVFGCEDENGGAAAIRGDYRSGQSARPDIRDNLIDGAETGIDMENASPTIQSNLIRFTDNGILLDDVSGARVRDNLIQFGNNAFNPSIGIDVQSATGSSISITGNDFHDIDIPLDLELTAVSRFSTISKNNFSTFLPDGCPVFVNDNTSARALKFSGNFWAAHGLPGEDGPVVALAGDCAGESLEFMINQGLVTFSRSSDTPLVSRYKDKRP